MLTTTNYFNRVRDIERDRLPVKLQEGFDYVQELTNGYTSWEFYHADNDIRAAVDQYLAALSDHLDNRPEQVNTLPLEQQAWDTAKDLIRTYVLRGDSMQDINKGRIGRFGGGYGAMVGNNKIHVGKIAGQNVDFSFPLKRIYDEILNESRQGKPAVQDGQLEQQAREAAKDLFRPYVHRGQSADYIKKANLSATRDGKSIRIQGSKVLVTMKETGSEFSFPVHSVYNEVKEETGSVIPTPAPSARKPTQERKPEPAAITKPRIITGNAAPVERIDEAVRFIKRYALLHGKTKTDMQILSFLNALQKAILERRIRKTSPYAEQIGYIQKNLVKLYNDMGREVEIKVQDSVLKEFLEIAGSQQVRLSVAYMKRYVGVQGKHIDKEKAKRLHKLVSAALDQQKISKTDPYRDRIMRVLSSLKRFIDKAKPADTLQLHAAVLNGIQQTLDGCCPACDRKKGLDGIEGTDDPVAGPPADDAVMNSVDFAGMEFETLGFTGKWKEFIGDPAPGFSAMVSGPPKMGKSYLCADFAGYLARHHGETLIVAGEEKLGHTLQQKIDAVKHPCLHVAPAIPSDLSPYDFIVLDSVTRLKLLPEQLRALKAANPGKSFIHVYQVTKAGKFRGSNEAQHDVDIVIDVPQKGRAIQFGRFNQGGEMNIFEPGEYRQMA